MEGEPWTERMALSEPLDGALPESVNFPTFPLARKILPRPCLTSVRGVFCHLRPRRSSLIWNPNGGATGTLRHHQGRAPSSFCSWSNKSLARPQLLCEVTECVAPESGLDLGTRRPSSGSLLSPVPRRVRWPCANPQASFI